MKSVTELRSLGDLRTTISTHVRSTPRLKGSTYLEIYLLDKEKQRLEAELTMMAKRRSRIDARLADNRAGIAHLLTTAQAQDEECVDSSPPASATPGSHRPANVGSNAVRWKTIPLEY